MTMVAGKEIERKFTYKKKPKPDPDTDVIKQKIFQTYLSIERGQSNLRVRRIVEDKRTTYTMTYKQGKGMSKTEVEFEIDKLTYDNMLKKHRVEPLIKERTKMYIDGYLCEFDKFIQKENKGIEFVEIEFETEEDALDFVPLPWMTGEVTDDSKYGNTYLWGKVQPKPKPKPKATKKEKKSKKK